MPGALSGRISTHALREEGDSELSVFFEQLKNFYPRPPRGGRPSRFRALWLDLLISTHALREEGDLPLPAPLPLLPVFLPTPSARRATTVFPVSATSDQFLPTPSARRATSSGDWLPYPR